MQLTNCGTVNCILINNNCLQDIVTSKIYQNKTRNYNKQIYRIDNVPTITDRENLFCNSFITKALKNDLGIVTYLNSWLSEMDLLDADCKIKVIRNSIITIENKTNPVQAIAFPKDTAQVTYLLLLLHCVPDNSIVLIENPEVYLHPNVQSMLGDLFLTMAKAKQLCLIFSSYSEFILRRLQRNIAEEKYSKNDVNIFVCEGNRQKNRLKQLELTEYGEIIDYPNNVFGDVLTEIVETQKAILKRKMRE